MNVHKKNMIDHNRPCKILKAMIRKAPVFYIATVIILFSAGGSLLHLYAQQKSEKSAGGRHSHADVARKTIAVFKDLQSWSADFSIKIADGRTAKSMTGTVYYQNPGKVRWDFSNPAGDFILSDGKILWIYIRRINAAGRQSLDLDVKTRDGRDVFYKEPVSGLGRLFSRYHYRFDTVDQPKNTGDGQFFVMDLEQREKIGGYEKIQLFIDPETYLIKKATGVTQTGRESTVTFSNIKINPAIEGTRFQYQPEASVRVVPNPLVNE